MIYTPDGTGPTKQSFRQPPTGDPTLLQQLLRDREHINADAGKPRSAEHRRPQQTTLCESLVDG